MFGGGMAIWATCPDATLAFRYKAFAAPLILLAIDHLHLWLACRRCLFHPWFERKVSVSIRVRVSLVVRVTATTSTGCLVLQRTITTKVSRLLALTAYLFTFLPDLLLVFPSLLCLRLGVLVAASCVSRAFSFLVIAAICSLCCC